MLAVCSGFQPNSDPRLHLSSVCATDKKSLWGTLHYLLDALRLFSVCLLLAVVAIAAGNEMDVVPARGGSEGGIHLPDIQAAMRV